jgi:hypothetical protein
MTTPTNQKDPEGRSHGVWEDYLEDGTLWWRGHYRHGEKYSLFEYHNVGKPPQFKEYYINIK